MVAIERLSGGLTPADGSDPRTFPAIWNATADDIEQLDADLTSLSGRVSTAESDITALDGRVTSVEGDVTTLQQGFRYAGTRYYTSPGSSTFLKADPLLSGDIGLRAIRVRVVGGGGGGAACGTGGDSVAGGGGGGGYAEAFITDIAGLDTSVSVTVGPGGAGGAQPSGVGGVGGASSFGVLVAANGGGASANLSRGGDGGVGTAGDLLIQGGGGNGAVVGDLSTLRPQLGGFGGASQLSGQTTPTTPFGGGVVGLSGQQFGGGGAGAVTTSNPAAFDGGPGAQGAVIVDVFV